MRTRTRRAPKGIVILGDGIETDRLAFGWGRRLEVRVGSARLWLLAQ